VGFRCSGPPTEMGQPGPLSASRQPADQAAVRMAARSVNHTCVKDF
jgi:hypothetical protein